MSRKCFLPLADLIVLDHACEQIHQAFGYGVFLVGSVNERADYRDVDLRAILPDDEFDHVFTDRPLMWSVVCLAISSHLSRITGLPVDFQIQRMTEANAEHAGKFRNPLGGRRQYAGGMHAASGTPDAPTVDSERNGQ